LKYRLGSLLLKKKTEKDVGVKKGELIDRPEISLEGVSTETFSTEVAVALADTRAVMSSEEAQRRFIAMIIAAAVVAEQFRRLQEAHIEGGEEELQKFRKALTDISTEPVVDLINKMLETNDGLNEDAGPTLVELLGGGGRVDGKYVPLRLEQLPAAGRLPSERSPGSAAAPATTRPPPPGPLARGRRADAGRAWTGSARRAGRRP